MLWMVAAYGCITASPAARSRYLFHFHFHPSRAADLPQSHPKLLEMASNSTMCTGVNNSSMCSSTVFNSTMYTMASNVSAVYIMANNSIVCTMANNSNACIMANTINTTYLQDGEAVGFTFVAESAYISLIAVLAVFVLLIVSSLTPTRCISTTHYIVRYSAMLSESVMLSNGQQICTW